MVVQNKVFGTIAVYAFMVVCLLYVVGMIVLPSVLIKSPPPPPPPPPPPHEQNGDFDRNRRIDEDIERFERNLMIGFCLILMFYLLVVLILRLLGTWKLWKSLKMCESKPREALKSLETTLNMEVAISVTSGCTLLLVPLAFFEIIFIYFLVKKYRDGLQVEVDRLGPEVGMGMMFMMGTGGQGPIPMMMPPQGINGAPWPVTSSQIYPPPTPNQVLSSGNNAVPS